MAGGNMCVKRLECTNLVLFLQQLCLDRIPKKVSELLQAANILSNYVLFMILWNIHDSSSFTLCPLPYGHTKL